MTHKKSKGSLGFMTPYLRVKGCGRKKEIGKREEKKDGVERGGEEKRAALGSHQEELAGVDEKNHPVCLAHLNPGFRTHQCL